jgi:hypothetical protein
VLCRRHVVPDRISLNGWDRRCWRVVAVFEICLRDGRVNVRFGGKRSSCLRLRSFAYDEDAAPAIGLPYRREGLD